MEIRSKSGSALVDKLKSLHTLNLLYKDQPKIQDNDENDDEDEDNDDDDDKVDDDDVQKGDIDAVHIPEPNPDNVKDIDAEKEDKGDNIPIKTTKEDEDEDNDENDEDNKNENLLNADKKESIIEKDKNGDDVKQKEKYVREVDNFEVKLSSILPKGKFETFQIDF